MADAEMIESIRGKAEEDPPFKSGAMTPDEIKYYAENSSDFDSSITNPYDEHDEIQQHLKEPFLEWADSGKNNEAFTALWKAYSENTLEDKEGFGFAEYDI